MIYKHEVKGNVEGVVEIRMPKYLERLELMKEISLDQKDGEVEIKSRVEPAFKLYAALEKHVLKVELKAGDQVIDSLESLGYYQEGVRLINELGALLIGGVRLGKI